MRKLLLICALLAAARYSHAQVPGQFTRNVAEIKGAIVKREQGEFIDPKTKKPTGGFVITYIIDTINHELLNATITQKDGRSEVIYLYYYVHNRLSKASSGVVQQGYTQIQNTYDYDDEDFAIKEKDLDAFSQTEEKYAMLKESRRYLAVLKKSN
jgi:hypothetical protein